MLCKNPAITQESTNYKLLTCFYFFIHTLYATAYSEGYCLAGCTVSPSAPCFQFTLSELPTSSTLSTVPLAPAARLLIVIALAGTSSRIAYSISPLVVKRTS